MLLLLAVGIALVELAVLAWWLGQRPSRLRPGGWPPDVQGGNAAFGSSLYRDRDPPDQGGR